MYGKEPFSVYPDGPAGTRSAAGGQMAFSGGFSVYLNNMRTSSVRCDPVSDVIWALSVNTHDRRRQGYDEHHATVYRRYADGLRTLGARYRRVRAFWICSPTESRVGHCRVLLAAVGASGRTSTNGKAPPCQYGVGSGESGAE